MNGRLFLGLLLCLILRNGWAQPTLPDGFTSQVVYKGAFPVSFTADHHGRLFIAEKRGRVVLLENDETATPLIVLNAESCCEHGLLGIAIDPDFELNHYIYVHYTVRDKNHNRVSRFRFNEEKKVLEDEEILLDLEPLSGPFHSGGCLRFGPDGKLYIATGDGSNSATAQNHSSLLGKMLRLNPDGTIPVDNPFYNVNNGIYRSIYAYGLRNPFTFSFNEGGRMFVNDVGLNNFEEINEVFAGKNYGWPRVEGFLKEGEVAPDNYVDPIYAYSHDVGCAVTGSVFFPENALAFPEFYRGKYFFGDYCNAFIKCMDPQTYEVTDFSTAAVSPIAFVATDPGDLYFISSNNEQILKISYVSDGAPRVTSQPKPVIAVVGETVQFTTSAVGTDPISYQWMKNSQLIPGANDPTLQLEDIQLSDDASLYSCRISNAVSIVETHSVPVTVTSRNRAQVTLDLTSVTLPYQAGDTIIIKGTAVDEVQGTLPGSSLTWKVDFHHNTHTHPTLNFSGDDSIAFVVPRIGETSSNVWFGIQLTAMNDVGLTTTIFNEIFPDKSDFVLQASRDSLVVYLDGKPGITPYTTTSVVGVTRNISVDKAQYFGDSIYYFRYWNEPAIADESITFNVSISDTAYTAHYESAFLGTGTGLSATYFEGIQPTDTVVKLARVDKGIDFDWGRYSPANNIHVDSFRVVWTGYLQVPEDGEYTFYTISDDGVMVIMDEDTVLNDPGTRIGLRNNSFRTYLKGLTPYKLHFQYTELASNSTVRWYWSSDNIQRSIVPVKALYPIYPEPRVTLEDPGDFVIGQNLVFEASATDATGAEISSGGFQWQFFFLDGGKKVAIDTIENTTSVSLLIPDSLFTKTSSTIEAVLKVTDQKGFWKKVSTRSKAKVSQLNISSSYDAEATLGGVHIALPLDTTFVAGHYIAFDSDPIQIFPDALLVATPEVVNTFESYLLENTNIVATYDRIPLNDGNGLNASYFSISKNFDERPDSTKVDSTINFKWDEQSMQGGLRVHWSGWITPPVEGLYTLKIVTGERANIIMDEDIFATDAETQMLQNPVFLKKGGYYPIDIYYTGTNSDTVSITWSSDILPEHIIPQNQLFTDQPLQTVNFYPNPFEKALHIHLTKYDGTKPVEIELVSLTGAIQFSTVVDPWESIIIPAETITRGMYFLKVNLQGHVFVYKVIKK